MIPEQMSPGDAALPTSLPNGKYKREKVQGDFQPAPLAFADEFSLTNETFPQHQFCTQVTPSFWARPCS